METVLVIIEWYKQYYAENDMNKFTLKQIQKYMDKVTMSFD